MRSNPKYASDFQLSALPAAIMETAEKGVDWTHIQALIETLSKSNLIDPGAVWDRHGRPLLGALMGAHRSGYDGALPVSVLDLILEIDPQALSRKDSGGNTPVDMFLDALESESKTNYRLIETATWWLSKASKEQLLAWIPRDRYGDTLRVEQNGYHLLTTVLKAEQTREREIDTTLLSNIADLGIDLNARNQQKNLGATWIKYKVQWEVFIARGGDAFTIVKDNHDKPTQVPFWRYMIERARGTAGEAAKQWARENAVDEWKKKAYNDYWGNLKERTKYGTSPSDIPGHLTGHPDFLTLRDTRGRTPAMYGILMHGSSWRVLEQKRFGAMNKERDLDGLTLWHYAFSKGKSMGLDTVKFLLKSGAPLDPNPVSGRGLIASVLIDSKDGKDDRDLDAHERWIRDVGAVKKLLANSTYEQWWAMKPGDKKIVMEQVNKLMDGANTAEAFNHVICQFAEHIDDEALVAKALKYNMNQYSAEKLNTNGVKLYFKLGMNPGQEDEDLKKLKSKMKPEDFAQVEAMVMDMRAPQVEQKSRGLRL